MTWVTIDYQRGERMSFRKQIKYNFFRPYWKVVNYLAFKGFFWTEEGCVIRLRDFTFKFWEVRLSRQNRKSSRMVADRDITIATLNSQVIREQTRLVIAIAEIVKSVGGEVVVNPETMRDSFGYEVETIYDPITKNMIYKVFDGKEASTS